jgi:S-formylglutathione hydrolase FrmB
MGGCNNLMFRFYRNKVNALCKKARLNYYNKSIAGVQQSDSRKWWSALKNIAGLQSSKNVSTIMFEGKSYSETDLANLLNDKFVAVGSSLRPCHTIAYRTSVCQRMKNITDTPVYADIRYGYVRHTLYTFQTRSHTVAYAGIRRGRQFFLSMFKNFVRIGRMLYTLSIF